ncbi:MAG: DUF1028 domain-containing protein [Planctomycetaceae bacterium]|nr:DUF1028 domain-containing protein [Planctomycetaceae bacterium]
MSRSRWGLSWLSCLVLWSISAPSSAGEERKTSPDDSPQTPLVATFSIVAFDPQTQELGIAVQSRLPGVGAIVPYAQAGVGAVATQSLANTRFGPEGLKRLIAGKSPQEAIDEMIEADPEREARQLGIVDAQGRVASFTGDECLNWAGSKTGENYTVQGNILTGPEVIDEMARAFEKTEGVLALRLLAALDAGQKAGGDRRGMQSAALLIVRDGWGYDGQSDRFRDLRVDDHASPIEELRRIYHVHRKVFRRPVLISDPE